MSAAGELVPARAASTDLVARPVPAGAGGGGSVYADFVGRLRPYIAPPPGELGWQAAGGVGMTLGGAGLLALLPAGQTIATSGVFKWVGRSGLASMLNSAGGFVEPLALFAIVVLIGIAAIYLSRWGATPALVFLTAQTWLGVIALAAAVIAWLYLLFVLVVNIAIWAFVIVICVCLAVIALWVLGLFQGS